MPPEYKLALVCPVLDSHEALRRQLRYWAKTVFTDPELRRRCQIVIADDMSDPPLAQMVWEMNKRGELNFTIDVFRTESELPWSQMLGQNMGVDKSDAEHCLMIAIDHIIPQEVFRAGVEFEGDKMHFPRKYAVLTEDGDLTRDSEVLQEYGAKPGDEDKYFGVQDIYIIRRSIYQQIGGYPTKHYGHYFGDSSFHSLYGELHRVSGGKVRRHAMGPCLYVFPEPARDVMGLFHKVPRGGQELVKFKKAVAEGCVKKGGYDPSQLREQEGCQSTKSIHRDIHTEKRR